jgi:hypothetical protein
MLVFHLRLVSYVMSVRPMLYTDMERSLSFASSRVANEELLAMAFLGTGTYVII